jgi:preprotein translocase subunit YajC
LGKHAGVDFGGLLLGVLAMKIVSFEGRQEQKKCKHHNHLLTPLYCSDEVRVVMGFVVINALYPHT